MAKKKNLKPKVVANGSEPSDLIGKHPTQNGNSGEPPLSSRDQHPTDERSASSRSSFRSEDLVDVTVQLSSGSQSNKPDQVSGSHPSWIDVDNGEGMRLEKIIIPDKNIKFSIEDIASELQFWENSIVCQILGGNPHLKVFEGFIRRVWNEYQITKVSSIAKGLYIVKLASRDHVTAAIRKGGLFFDGKPIIIEEWTPDFDVNAAIAHSLPVLLKK